MRKYRFRTAALIGPWRDSEDQALADAARAQQVSLEGAQALWLVPGQIEETLLNALRPMAGERADP